MVLKVKIYEKPQVSIDINQLKWEEYVFFLLSVSYSELFLTLVLRPGDKKRRIERTDKSFYMSKRRFLVSLLWK